ncbi:hemocytin-like [Trichoplusia ni]|uniref:Hemocytin-like n=1 Tax=Trichoplusia ni TaxID=7111 RepID=A0A7E5X388_TRINI|nr:hemocytin-like [Trichoplusia ni]
MYLVTQALILLLAIYFSNAGYGIPAPSPSYQYGQSDVQAPEYVPPYLKNQRYGSNRYGGTKSAYSGTKTAPSGTKTAYSGTKSAYGRSPAGSPGTKNAYSGTKSKYSETKTWYSNTGNAPNYYEFHNSANQPFMPKCEPACKNMGICVDTNMCQCPANFHGKFCEFEKKPCLSYPPLPMNSRRTCSSETCTITCMEGHKFIDGSTVANMRCMDGQWQPTRADFSTIPDCEPECSPPCTNGGVCLAVNTCECPADYRGPQCQYSVSVCDIRKLAFNGAYNCAGDSESSSCALSCPPGATYSSPPAALYTCRYDTGVFQPQPIPNCVFPEIVVITPGSHTYNSTYTYTEYTSESHGRRRISSESQSGMTESTHGTHSVHSIEDLQSHGLGRRTDHGTGGPITVVVQDLTPKGGTCLTWAGVHYKTFDGKIYSFQSPCQHILVRDANDHKYSVEVKHGDCQNKNLCPSELTVYLEDKFYVLSIGEDGSVLFRNTKRLIPIPAALPGVRVSMPSDYVVIHLDAVGVTMKWDTNDVILVEGSVLLWNSTEGLCGTLDGNPENDFRTRDRTIAKTKTAMASSWQVNKIGDVCDSVPTETSACSSEAADDVKKAQQFCANIFSKEKFRKCSEVMDVTLLLEACQWDYCACSTTMTAEECACSTVAVYAKECLRHGVTEMKDWRDADTCPMKCPEGKIYNSCGSDSQASCAFPLVAAKSDNSSCVEGCYCPEGLLLEAGRCVPKAECPCRLRNKSFKPGASIRKDCNTCTCESGEWTCTKVPCGARCGAVGDPHYTTFDGMRYDFMGHCTYTMLQADNITIEVENVACSGAITEAMDLSPYKGAGKPSCTKAVTLYYAGANVHMKQGGFILVNGKEVSALPVLVGDVRIRAASSMFVIVQLPNKVDLWWDGNTRVFIDVPANFQGKTKGLCGTFNLNQKDDFLTPENDVEQSALAFANKWKTREFCTDVETVEPEHPCKANIENKEAAEKYCSKLKGKVFEECHWYVDVEPYYEACVYDMCACGGDAARCLCPVLGHYAMDCAARGVTLQWRYHVQECELQCNGGQEYTVCADSCLRKCADMALATSGTCKPCCVEGCACPAGQLLDDNNLCVPIGLCPCFHKGMQFNAGYKEVRAGRRERELCTCVGARWDCKPATPMEIQNYPPAEDLRSNCSASNNMEFTTCEIAEPLTCKNMHLPPSTITAECRPGCQCKKGFVLDTASKKCVPPTQCPCHHGGRSYPDGHVMQEECNKCECKSGNWACTQRKCDGLCAAWGDSHVVTFDGTDYDFEGVCTYLLAKGIMDTKDGFDVEIQNVPCGTTGATCSKSVTLKIGGGGDEEIVSLTKDAPIPDISKLKRIKMRMAGAYVFLDVPSLGMSLQWDRGMRVYVKVESIWQGRVKGLCGNYNGDMRDDFQTPSSGGMAESSALIFADSWKLKATCPKPEPLYDHCKQRPERKEWASSTCSTMKQYPFTLCHAEVSPSPYIARCTRDACACDSGDDCECACTALAAYAHACAHRGVTFKWRTQEICPMQCDEECSNYDACLTPCPVETCDNTLEYADMKTNCEKDTCVEGCKPKKSCPKGQVYKNSSHSECVPRAKCKKVCMTLEDGTEVAEGEVMEEDDCHTCRCSKKQKICTGLPCTTVSSEETTQKPHDEPLKCVTGWSNWINRGPPEIGPSGESIDNEPLPRPNELVIGTPMCKERFMKKIECRTVEGHKSAKETGLDAECSLERGLYCKEKDRDCLDFEIRVYCECDNPEACENSIHPSEAHPTDCSKFYECSPDGPVLKECGVGTWYNPNTMVCDWPAAVLAVRPDCAQTTTSPKPKKTTKRPPVVLTISTGATEEPTTSVCPPGLTYSSCAYRCDRLCDFYKQKLVALGRCIGEKCVEGCVAKPCGSNKFWRDEKTCVHKKDCTCSSNGKIVKPGGVVVDGCIKCQCLDNNFHCDSSDCVVVVTPRPGSTHQPIIFTVPGSTTPPTVCDPDDYKDVLADQPDSAFSASSVASGLFEPQYARLHENLDVTAGSWSPKEQNTNQYIQVELVKPEPIFGVTMQGSPLFDQYVTTYQVLYGDDEDSLKPVLDSHGEPKVFPGPTNHSISQTVMIEPPVETKIIRIRPLTWHEEISIRFELIGCGGTLSTLPEESTTMEPETTEISSTAATMPTTKETSPPTKETSPPTKETSPPTTETTTPIPETTPYMYYTAPPTSTTPIAAPLIIPNTVTPPPECTQDGYYDLMWGDEPLPDSAFSASSIASGLFQPQYAKLNGHPLDVTAGSWNPAVQDANQYIQVKFSHPEPIYGVVMQGSPLFDQYVTSYYVLYGNDGVSFSSVNEPDGSIKVFRGPTDNNKPMTQLINPPIEAMVVRIQPLTWHEEIAVRFELVGCREPNLPDTTKTTVSFTEPPQCDEPLGLAADLPVQSIEVSSNNDARQYFKLEGERGWRPLYSTPGEWIMFNFTSPRNITGIKTKGGPKGWVSTYKILYTSDLSTFNPVIEEDGEDKLFAGNFDKDTAVVNEFRPPIHAQYLKVLPLKWKDAIEMRIEPIGCFEPYPATEKPELTTTPTTPSVTETCVVCPGVLQDSDEACSCAPPDKYYDGENCVSRDQCPCVEGIMTYPVGSTFRGANCDECVCKLGGITDCKPVEECNCAPDLVPKLSTSTCDCRCTPCPENTKICPTSKMCLPLEKWCDGLQDCPDDEKECTTTTTTTAPVTTPFTTEAPVASTKVATVTLIITTPKPEECPKVECPANYSVQYTSPNSRPTYSATELPPPRARHSYQRYHRGHAKGGYTKTVFSKGGSSKGGFSKGGYGLPPPPQPNQAFSLNKPELSPVSPPPKAECAQFKCIPKLPPFRPGRPSRPPVCAVTICPQGYTLKLDVTAPGHNRCPQYDCVPPPERPVFCNVTGRTFNTFDGVEYKFDACFHILARENRFDAWTILLRKKCRLDGCRNELLIMQDDQLILVKPNMMIEYDNYEYTVEQTNKICFQKNSFNVNRLGNGIAVSSRKYNFTVLYSSEGDIKIGVFKSYMGAVDGLCGAFDGEPQNDRRMPDGRLTASIAKFGRSWAKPGLPPDACQIKLISDAKQKKAWDLCEVIMKAPLWECGGVLNLHKWRNICLEKICECAGMEVNGTHRTEEQCRCLLVEQMVAECLAADKNIELSDWRIMNDCPAECPPPLVHYDCYRKSCEPSCSAVGVSRSCPTEDGQCFPGCYCPEGKLRRGDQCVLPTDCLDCSCNGVGVPAKYVTFEGDDLPYLGNCTYLASRDRNSTGAHKYEVYSTNGPCDDNADVACTHAVHLLYERNVIHVTKDSEKKLLATIGNNAVFKYPMKNEWVTINQVNGQDLTIFLPDIHVELTVLQSKLEFTVRVPSYLYANRTEGMCGVCAGYQEELVMSNGTATDDFDQYGKSWQASPEALKALDITEQGECEEPPPPPECVPPPPESNPCYNLYNADRFGACHALVEPESFVKACETDVCANATDACVALERYAAACSRQGVCLQNWRDDLCPFPCEEPLVYRACVDCELTCENSDELSKNPDKCAKQPGEGCFCPEGKVRVNNTCIEPAKCFPCDANKEHYAGDEWKEDACTVCSCARVSGSASAHVTCTRQACSAPVCYQHEDLVTQPPRPGDCCATYTCVQKPKQNCTEPKKMTCAFGQVLKQKTTPEGCQEFACECKPVSECEPLPNENEVEIMEPGMERLVDNSGCCPRVQFVCRAESCPQPPACPKFHDAKTTNVTGKCCPEHTCELPKDKCIATLEWEAASKGGEKPRTTPQTILKDLDSVWLDGPCRSCRCEADGAGAAGGRVRCAASECAAVLSTEQFVLEPRPVPFQCCPQPVQVACRDRDNIYKVGENWTSPTNPCESYQCVQTDTEGKLEKITTVQQCHTECQPGWKYFPATEESGACCGQCEPVACIVDGKERAIGERWTSSDFCANYTCVNLNGTLQVECANETCPEVSENVKKMFVLSEEKIPGKCCPKEEPVACRVGSLIYQEGQTWPSPDPCKNVTCARDASGRLTQQESVATCAEDCRRGWLYERPAPGVCCGHCRQKDCVVDDKLIPPGTTWHSDDNCTTYSCDQTGEEVFVTSSKQLCPDVSACAPENLVNDTCCQVCEEHPEALSKCVPTSVPTTETVGLVRIHLGPHGLCVNKLPLTDFKECRGSCDSGTLYNNQTGIHDTRCECCQATKYTPVQVMLSCEDGTAQAHRLASPAACACAACNAADKPMWPGKPGYAGVKHPTKTGYSESEEDEIPQIYQRFGSPRPRL